MVWVVGLGFFACFVFFFPPSRCHRDCGVLPPPSSSRAGLGHVVAAADPGALRGSPQVRGVAGRRVPPRPGSAGACLGRGGEGRGGGRAGTWGWPGREGSAAGGGRARPVSAAAAAGTASAVPAWQVRLEGSPEGGVRGGGVCVPLRGAPFPPRPGLVRGCVPPRPDPGALPSRSRAVERSAADGGERGGGGGFARRGSAARRGSVPSVGLSGEAAGSLTCLKTMPKVDE